MSNIANFSISMAGILLFDVLLCLLSVIPDACAERCRSMVGDLCSLSSNRIHAPVGDCGFSSTSFAFPCSRISPPFSPAPGPISIIQSARLMRAGLWSISTSVFPRDWTFLRTFQRASTSLWCNPLAGSSRTISRLFRCPVLRLESRSLWTSPPERVAPARPAVR